MNWKDKALENLQIRLENQARKVSLLALRLEREQDYMMTLIKDLKDLNKLHVEGPVPARKDASGVYRSA